MKRLIFVLFAVVMFAPIVGHSAPPHRQYYEIRVYHLSGADQEKQVDTYLKDALLPALHRDGIQNIGVLKPLSNDTSSDKRTYVIIPYASLNDFGAVSDKIEKDKDYLSAASGFLNAPHDNPPYVRIEKFLTKAFEKMTTMQPPALTGPRTERVYEMRSYESATEALHGRKVKMFNDGNEVAIFKRLGFNAVFYSQAITGTVLPNLVYMITFDDMASHDAHWKAFGSDPEWKKLSSMDEYANTVSKINSYLLRPTDYSDY